jgi:hypothetical protein
MEVPIQRRPSDDPQGDPRPDPGDERANWLRGAPRIDGELLTLGIEVAESTVAKHMVKRPGRPGQIWTTFQRNHAAGIAATDLFVVPTIGFKLLYCPVFLAHGRRELVHHAVTVHPTANGLLGK